jgi:thioredoxin-like negative regulator of GroEL|tara:strand:- start:92 stop:343 length:252 start_codon:yes stop_codon:yes gene_type:complete
MNKLIYVSAIWCGPCRQFGPIMDKVAATGIPVQKMDADKDQQSIAKYGVRSVPTVVKVDSNNNEISRLVGVKLESEVIEFYNK